MTPEPKFSYGDLSIVSKKNEVSPILTLELLERNYKSISYLINKSILFKASLKSNKDENLNHEVMLLEQISNKVAKPKLLIYDQGKELIDFDYALYKIPGGKPLCTYWNGADKSEKSTYLKGVISILENLAGEQTKLKRPEISWYQFITQKTKRLTHQFIKTKCNEDVKQGVKNYLRETIPIFRQSEQILTFKEFKLDYFLADERGITGLLNLDQLGFYAPEALLTNLYKYGTPGLTYMKSKCVPNKSNIVRYFINNLPFFNTETDYASVIKFNLLVEALEQYVRKPSNKRFYEYLLRVFEHDVQLN